MKAAAFEYVRADSLDDVCRILAAPGGGERKVIAGGQTLVPLMAMRLARPELLVDVNGLEELGGIAVEDGALAVGAGTRQRDVERSAEAARAAPLLVKALGFVGHQQIRNRGTIGGSLVHGDPAAEIPLVAATLDAGLEARSARGPASWQAASGFFLGPMTTALAADQCLVRARFPVWDGPRIGTGFQEVASRKGDFAVVAACVQLKLDADGRCARIAAGLGGVAPAPVRLSGLEAALLGRALDEAALAGIAAEIAPALDPDDDLHATAAYRRRVAAVLLARAIEEARREAGG